MKSIVAQVVLVKVVRVGVDESEYAGGSVRVWGAGKSEGKDAARTFHKVVCVCVCVREREREREYL